MEGDTSDCATSFSHRVTFFLDGTSSVSVDTNSPEVCRRQIQDGIDGYYKRWWQKRTKTTMTLEGKSQVVIPIAKIQCFKIEPINE